MSIFKCNQEQEIAYNFELDDIVCRLREKRTTWRTKFNRNGIKGKRRLPSVDRVGQAVEIILSALFPMQLGPSDLHHENEDFFVAYALDKALNQLLDQTLLELEHQKANGLAEVEQPVNQEAVDRMYQFSRQIATIKELLNHDIVAALTGDPAATSIDEVILCYPGVKAMMYHRIAHQFYRLGLKLIARIIGEISHGQTGIDIHPGAQIDEGCFIDHGTGVVIGETAILGKRIRIYQQVTLGAKSFPSDEKGNLKKGILRHPIVEDDVVIYAGATILGRVTIGKGAIIGGNVWLVEDVEPETFISQAKHGC